MQTCSENNDSADCFSVTLGIPDGNAGFVGLPGDVGIPDGFEDTFSTRALQYAFWQPGNVMSQQISDHFA